MKLSAICAALALILARGVPAYADVRLSLSAIPNDDQCDIADPGPGGTATVHVLVKRAEGVTGFAFAAPPLANNELVYTGYSSPYTVLGDPVSGFDVGTGTCLAGDFVLMSMTFVRVAGDPCIYYQLKPHPTEGLVYLDCTFAEKPLRTPYGVLFNSDGTCDKVTVPSDPVPADGAVGVPLLFDLDWEAHSLCEPMLCGSDDEVYFGTTPDPPFVGASHRVGPLAPETTYYWRARNGCPWSDIGPLWHFTTTAELAVQASTWGAIKALYR